MMRRSAVAVLAMLLLAACNASEPYRLAVEPRRADIVAAVREYYGFRDRLTDGFEINEFWQRYPDLSYEHDLPRGINLELMLWKWSHDPQLVRQNYRTDLESYQPIRVFVRGIEAVAIVHGIEAWDHEVGPPTSGEFRTVLSLRSSDGRWTVVRSDEQTMGEPLPTDPPTR
jgi:hypothetical protein